jgi:adenylylsulfate kinase-like enzyme
VADLIPVLWVCGPPGVGKTTVAWEIYSQLIGSGTPTGYVDIDQLGICYPEPASDPGRHKLKARNLAAVVANLRAEGARCVVVSGVVDAANGIDMDQFPHADLTVCRLHADPEELVQRFSSRGTRNEYTDAVLREAEAMESSTVAGVAVDTTGVSPAEVARQVRERSGGWPLLNASTAASVAAGPTRESAGDAGGPILWLCGATGVGKSTVGFLVYQRVLRSGQVAAYIDVDQIGFSDPAPADHRMRAANLSAMWHTYRTMGAQALVAVGPVPDEASAKTYADALPAATITWCRLHAGRRELAARIRQRGQGGSWPQPGDPLKGRSTAHLLAVADGAAADADELERRAVGLRIDTDGRTAEQTADLVLALTGWPDGLSSTPPT